TILKLNDYKISKTSAGTGHSRTKVQANGVNSAMIGLLILFMLVYHNTNFSSIAKNTNLLT
ncbi:TPA: hypothetical protein ACGOTA_001905, partial [Streptococcus suis]